MKKLILSLLATCVLGSSAMASDTAFTLQEAQKNCATLTSISFKANNPSMPNSAGTLSGINQVGVRFTSWNINTGSKNVVHPKNDPIGIQFEVRTGYGYGHKVGDVITCFYKYAGFTGTTAHQAMTTAYTTN